MKQIALQDNIDRPGIGRPDIDRPGIDRPGIDRPGIDGWSPANRMLRRIAAELDRFESVDLNTFDAQELIDFQLEWEYFRSEVSRFEFLFANRLHSLDYAMTA